MMLSNGFSFGQSDSCNSEVFESLKDKDNTSSSIKKSNEFLQLIEQLNATNFSDDENLVKVREMANDTELSGLQWKKITLILIDGLILNKNRLTSSEPNEENEFPNKDDFTFFENHINQTKSPKYNIPNKSKSINDSNVGITIEDEFNKKIEKEGWNLWGKGEEQLVPFEIGMKILDDNIDANDYLIGIKTKKKIKKIEDDACRMAYKRMSNNPDYQRLFHEKEHWKYLAKTRLIELENEIDFRYQLVFGDEKKKYL